MTHSTRDSMGYRSERRIAFRSVAAGLLVASLAFIGPTPAEAADQPIVNIPVARLAPAPMSNGDFTIPDAQPSPASRWPLLSVQHLLLVEAAPVNAPPARAFSLGSPLAHNASLARPSVPAAPAPPSFGRPVKKKFLILGLVGVGIAVFGGGALAEVDSKCTSSYEAIGNHQSTCSDFKDATGAILGVGIGLAALGFTFSFHH